MATVEEIQMAIDRLNKSPDEKDYFDEVMTNVGPSANAALQDFISAFSDPIGTAKDTYDLGVGLYSLATDGDKPEEEIARALGEYYGDRYGSFTALKNSFKTDPVGVALDLSSIVSGVGGAARGSSGLVRKVSEKAGADKATAFFDKVQGSRLSDAARNALILSDTGSGAAVGRVARSIPELAGRAVSNTLGLVSGAPGDAIERSFNVGRTSLPLGDRAKTFTDTARGEGILSVSPERFATDSKDALSSIRRGNSAQYRAGSAAIDMGPSTPLKGVSTSRTSVPGPISSTGKQMPPVFSEKPSAPPQINRPFFSSQFKKLSAIRKDQNSAKGKFSQAEGFVDDSANAINAIEQDIIEFSKSPLPDKEAAFQLRQKIDAYPFVEGTQEFRIRADLRADLSKQLKKDPKYRKVVEDFDEANTLAKEIESELSLGRTKNVSQSLRKLQSITRNNVSTNFGRRVDLLSQLNPNMDYDPLDVASALSLQSTQPMGGSRIGQSAGQTGGILSVGQEGTSAAEIMAGLAAASGVNPRNVGRASFGVGRAAQAVSPITTPIAGILPTATNAAFALERADTQSGSEELKELVRKLKAANAL